MLESAEVGHAISKAAYAQREPRLRSALLNAQFDLSQSKKGPVLLIISGVEGGGRSETANKLTEWMDPRHIRVMAFGERACEELTRPPAWRYWRALPPKGRIGIFLNAWYTEIVAARIEGTIDKTGFEFYLQETRSFERMLFDEGFILLKFWIHLSKNASRDRIRKIEQQGRSRNSPYKLDYKVARAYQKLRPLWEEMLRETSTAEAPWTIVEAADERYRHLTVGKVLLDAMAHASSARPQRPHAPGPTPAVVDNVRLLRELDLTQQLSPAQYGVQLVKWQTRLAELTQHKRFRDHSLILAFEGSDAAGKGSAIRRVTGALDARQYVTVPIAAPTSEELMYPYLWRFWRNVPPRGGITIFDRTWYGRVLVERVEGYCSEFDWRRAYEEINQFEEQLADDGAVLCKFWLQVSKAEQYKRFKAREKTPFKRFKITPDDWRNRAKWDAYEQAVADMVDRTSTELAPWMLVEADDKYFARVKVLKTIVRRLEAVIG
ncbi:MAG TPA: polyphosphate:AMP phosphotransferase [Casimicrobiaceae bacterium]|jgi:polyphosphate:AMP phosphotransferase